MYRVIQEIDILVSDGISHCEKKSAHNHVSNSEWLLRYSCLIMQT